MINPEFVFDDDKFLLFDRKHLNEYIESGRTDAKKEIDRLMKGENNFIEKIGMLKNLSKLNSDL